MSFPKRKPVKAYCHLCGKPIARGGRLFQHPRWPRDRTLRVCPDCYRDKPRCQICAMPMAASAPNGVCVTCAESLHFCLACGQVINAGFFEVDGVGPYCESCIHNRPACDVCGAPLTDERWQLSDGRLSCAHCHATAVYSPSDAVVLYEEMKSVVAQSLGLTLNIPTGLGLVDRNQLAEIIRQQSNGQEALDPERTLGVYARRGIRRGIYVQSGLPRLLLLQITAHEYAHAWQGENTPLLREPIVHEGFAEWVAFKVMGHYGLARQQAHMQARPDIYGQGLKWALDVEAKQGIPGLIEACQMTR